MKRRHNKGRASIRRGRVARNKENPVDVYISNMFRSDENGMKPYAANLQMRAEQTLIRNDVNNLLDGVLKEMFSEARGMASAFAEEVETMKDELVEATPWHADGPSDPPLHAAEAWNVRFYPNKKNSFTLTISNPKDYLPFLEAGWSPQAPAGWIAAIWLAFKTRVADRMRNA